MLKTSRDKAPVMVRMHSVKTERRLLSSTNDSSSSSSSSSPAVANKNSVAESPRSDHTDEDDTEDPAITAARAATLRAHVPRWTSHSVEEPSVLSLADPHITITGKHRSVTESAPNQYPMHFAQSVRAGGHQRPALTWMWRQGGDPLVHPHVHEMLDKELRPLIVIRLNPFDPPEGASTRLEDHYGPHCQRVFYVYDMAPSMIKEYDRTIDDSVRTIHALAVILGDLYEGVLSEMEKIAQSPDRLPAGVTPAVYLHCHMGLERSRFMFIALHGLFYANHAIGEHSDSVLTALDGWAARQALFVRERLSVGTLLTRDQPTMFISLIHALAALLGVDQKRALQRIMRHEHGPVARTRASRRALLRHNILNICAAGALCQRSVDNVNFMCMGCHSAFFCSLECVESSSHLTSVHTAAAMCTKHYPQEVYPKSLYTRRVAAGTAGDTKMKQ